MTRPTVDDAIERGKVMITGAIASGLIPADARSFGQLDDYTDRNRFVTIHPDGDGWIAKAWRVEDALDDWLRAGRPGPCDLCGDPYHAHGAKGCRRCSCTSGVVRPTATGEVWIVTVTPSTDRGTASAFSTVERARAYAAEYIRSGDSRWEDGSFVTMQSPEEMAARFLDGRSTYAFDPGKVAIELAEAVTIDGAL